MKSKPMKQGATARALQKLVWHDGRVRGVHLTARRPGNVMLDVELYPSEEASQRQPLRLALDGVSDFYATANLAALDDNLSAGNICCCRIETHAQALSVNLHLLDGHVRIVARRALVKRGRQK
jgi:hypothetical protein